MLALYSLQVLTCPRLSKFPKVRRIRRICDVAFIVKKKVKINLVVIISIISCTEWQDIILNIVDLFILLGSEFF
jgi:hypothetical protein